MHLQNIKRSKPALFTAALAFFFCAISFVIAPNGSAQKIKQLPPPPPVPRLKPKPTPTPEPIEYEVVKITSNLIVVPVSVTDVQGQPILGLQQTDFRIQEDGRQQQIAQLGDPGQVPLDIAVLIDISSSVSSKGFFTFEKEAATRFLSEVLKPADTATIFAIDREPRLEQSRAPASVATARLLTISGATGPSPTSFYDTVSAAARYLAANTPEQHRRVIVAISDGEDNFSNSVRDSSLAAYRATESEDLNSPASRPRMLATVQTVSREAHRKAQAIVQRDLQTANAVFYAINPSGEGYRLNIISVRAQEMMNGLAVATGGAAFVPGGHKDLTYVFNRITSELRAQYLLQYYSDNKAGIEFRRINVTAPSHPELRVRAREGYYPKAK